MNQRSSPTRSEPATLLLVIQNIRQVFARRNRQRRTHDDNPQGFLTLLRCLKGDTVSEVVECAESLYPSQASSEARTAAQIVALIDVEQREVDALSDA